MQSDDPKFLEAGFAIRDATEHEKCSHCVIKKAIEIAHKHGLSLTVGGPESCIGDVLSLYDFAMYLHPPGERVTSENVKEWSEKWHLGWLKELPGSCQWEQK